MTKNVPELKLELDCDGNHKITGLQFPISLFTGWFITEKERSEWIKQAERMVVAWNSHQDLVEALKTLYGAIDGCVDLTPEIMNQAHAVLIAAEEAP